MPKNNPVNKTKTSHYTNMDIGSSCCALPPLIMLFTGRLLKDHVTSKADGMKSALRG